MTDDKIRLQTRFVLNGVVGLLHDRQRQVALYAVVVIDYRLPDRILLSVNILIDLHKPTVIHHRFYAIQFVKLRRTPRIGAGKEVIVG